MRPAEQSGIAGKAKETRKRYGGLVAVDGVPLSIEDGEVFGIIGPNGAGKSTLFDVLCGITKPTSGQVEVLGQDVVRISSHLVARAGVARTFQRTAVFGEATVYDNLLYDSYGNFQHSVMGR